jgi:protein-L-isoaspartate(D-aspartate) O-methyltransferase
MTAYPTDLDPDEERTARARLRDLAEQFVADGSLRSGAWRAVFERTSRHPYLPSYYPSLDSPAVLSLDSERRREWLSAVYSDTTLLTKIAHVPLSTPLRPATSPAYASSSTLPSLMLRMLEELDVTNDCRVLEIGTGTGYNAALLCERLGSQNVTSIDIDAELIELARERLAANGHKPTLAVADGAGGFPTNAPYDRIIATCSVSAIPPAWLHQTAPGAVILADIHGDLGGTLAKMTVNEQGTATGRFVAHWAGFMRMRPDTNAGEPQHSFGDNEPTTSHTQLDPSLLQTSSPFSFVAQWHLPGIMQGLSTDPEHDHTSLSLSAPDGSYATICGDHTRHGYQVTQAGPRRLWDRVEEAHQFWTNAGQPNSDQFGITATPTEQRIWYDHPNSAHHWSLPTPPARRTTQR